MTINQAESSTLQALQVQEVLLSRQLAAAEVRLKNYEQQFSTTTSTVRLNELVRDRENVATLRLQLEGVRFQIMNGKSGATQSGRQVIARVENGPVIMTVVPATVGTTEQPLTMFGLTPSELRGPAEFILLLPLVLALSRWIWRRSPTRANRDNSLEGNAQINRLEQSVEAIAIEVERISEAQRFSAKLMAERPQEPVIERLRASVKPQRRVVTPIP